MYLHCVSFWFTASKVKPFKRYFDILTKLTSFRRRRRRKGQDVTAHIGANPDELLEDASNVSMRNWGLETPGTDPADTRFANTPPPVIVR